MKQFRIVTLLILAALSVAGCSIRMGDQPAGASHQPMTPTYFPA